MKKINGFLNKLNKIIVAVSFVGLAALMLLNVVDVIVGKLFTHSIAGAYEISECILLCTVFASFAYGQSKGVHVRMMLLVQKFPHKVQYVFAAFCNILSAGIAGLCTYATFFGAARKLRDNAVSQILMFPLYPFYYIAAVCMAIFAISMIFDALVSIVAIFDSDYEEMARKGW